MPKINLTAKTLAALKPQATRVDYFDTNLPSFCVRVTPTGAKSFSIMYRHAGRLRRHTIGTYPRLSLAKARTEAKDALRDAELGEDPASKKKAKRQADTFGELAADFMERYSKKRKKSWREDQRIIDSYLLTRFKNVRAKEISRAEIRAMLEEIAEDAPVQANRVLALLRKIYNWAIAEDLVDQNPCLAIPRPGKERQRDRVLSEDELKKVWKAIEGQAPGIAAIFKLRLITAQRGGEVVSIRWKDLDFDGAWWTIPGERTKNGLTHRVPLSPSALRVLESLREQRKASKSAAVRSSAWVFPHRSRPTEPITEIQKAAQRIRKDAGVTFRAHDLRRTAASLMTGLGIARLTVGKILNHSERGVTAVYDRHSYDREKREALEMWAKKLMVIVSELAEAKSD